jgi:hypothetical protein
MRLDRRRFLTKGGLTLGLGDSLSGNLDLSASRAVAANAPLSDHQRLLAETPHLTSLGLPRSWQAVREGFHPFSPDRVSILPARDADRRLKASFYGERLQKRLAGTTADLFEDCFWSSDLFWLIYEVSRILAAYYPGHSLENWLMLVVWGRQQESLVLPQRRPRIASLWSLALPPAHAPQVENPPVDWWLFLSRQPLALQGWDELHPMHVVTGHVFSDIASHRNSLMSEFGKLYGRFEDFLAEREPSFGIRVARMNRVEAARFANECMMGMLRGVHD